MRIRSTLALVVTSFMLLLVLACAPAAPSPGAARGEEAPKPAKEAPAAAVTKPAEALKPAATPAGKSSSPAEGKGDWQAEWDKTVAAGKQEGKLFIAGFTGDASRNAALAFRQAYPDIQIEYTGIAGSEFVPKVLAERDAGQYLWDVHTNGATSAISNLLPKGILDPVKPALLLPEVVDDSKWLGGLDNVWSDKGKQYVFGFSAVVQYSILVNRDIVPESELSTIAQLLDPKWKGKIVAGDPRVTGTPNAKLTVLYLANGEDWLRKFLQQDIAILGDERSVVEAVIRGRYPIMVNVAPATEAIFRSGEFKQLAQNVKPLDPEGPGGAGINAASGNAMLINKPPHPNAARVYINWLLSKEGQQAYVDATSVASARLDVAGSDQNAINPKIKYINDSKEDILPDKKRVIDIAKEYLK